MYAIIKSGGKQLKVSPGDVIRVEKLAGENGSAVVFPAVAVAADEQPLRSGKDVFGSKVLGSIVGAGRSPKVIVFKFKRKKQHKKTQGHRQSYTSVKINEIQTG